MSAETEDASLQPPADVYGEYVMPNLLPLAVMLPVLPVEEDPLAEAVEVDFLVVLEVP